MTVSYELSPCGWARRDNVVRTGIYRVVDRLARGLAATPATEIGFYSLDSWTTWQWTKDWLKSTFGEEHERLRVGDDALADAAGKVHKSVGGAFDTALNGLTQAIDARPDGLERSGLRALRRAGAALKGVSDWTGRLADRAHMARTLAEIERCDVFHSSFLPLPARGTAKSKGPVRFITVYDVIPLKFPELCRGTGGVEKLTRILNSITPDDWVFCISECTKRDLAEMKPELDPARMLVAPLAADEWFRPCEDEARRQEVRKRCGIPDGPFLLSVCTFEPRKNLPGVIRSFARLVEQEKIEDLSLVLVGTKGWDYDSIFETIAGAKAVQDRIIVTGYLDDELLAPLYTEATAFVFCTFYEGFGLPPLEAMQCGTPVITSNNSSLPEVVGEAAIQLDVRDEDGLCQSMLEVVRSSTLRAEMRAKSLARAKMFSWERFMEQTLAGYQLGLAEK